MAIPDIQTWPDALNRAVSSNFTLGALNGQSIPLFRPVPNVFAEPFDQRFFATIESPPLSPAEKTVAGKFRPSWREVEGRMAALKGIGGRVRLFDPLKVQPAFNLEQSGTLSNWSGGATWSGGAQWISGFLPPFVTVAEAANAEATSVVFAFGSGWASTARIMRWGDTFECRPNGVYLAHGAYHIVTGESATDSAGKVRVYFEPGLRVGLNVGDQIVLKYPTTVFTLLDDKQGIVTRDAQGFGRFGWSLVESLPYER